MRWIGVLVILLALVVGTGCGGPLTEFTLRDLRAGQARAEQAGDPVWATCYQVLADDLEARSHARAGGPPAGLADAAMLAHLLYSQSQGGVSAPVKEHCSQVALEMLIFMARVGLKIGSGGLPIPGL